MPNKFETIEDLDRFAEKLKKTKETLVKALAKPSEELIKFNDHGQWQLSDKEKEARKGEGAPGIAGAGNKMSVFGGV